MTYKTILTIIENEEEASTLIDNAIGLARSFDAHLIGYHSEPVQVAYASAVGFPDADFIRTTTEMGIERAKRIASQFGAKVREAGVSAEWGNPKAICPTIFVGAFGGPDPRFTTGQGWRRRFGRRRQPSTRAAVRSSFFRAQRPVRRSFATP